MGTALGGSGLSFLFWGAFCGRKSRSFTPLIVTSLPLTNLEHKARGKLQRAGKTVWTDFLSGSKVARTGVGDEIAGLIG